MKSNNIYVDGKYSEDHPSYHVEDSPWKAQQVMKIIRNNGLSVNTICEVGCGAGEILHQLHIGLPNHINFVGYDISPQAINICINKESTRLRFFNEDFLRKETPFYDLILCMDVFEHVEDYFGFLRKLSSKGHYKIFHIPLDMSVQMVIRYKSILNLREKAGHLHYFMKETALKSLADAGYEIVDWFYTPAGVDRPKNTRMKIGRYPRKLFFWINKDFTVRVLGGYSLLVLSK